MLTFATTLFESTKTSLLLMFGFTLKKNQGHQNIIGMSLIYSDALWALLE